jgi:SAM-dependent methyltransferase
VVSLLDVRPDDHVLEIGFGPGLAILQLSRIARQGYVCGIDHSELMLRQAAKRNADGIACGVVNLQVASVDAPPDFDLPFDKILLLRPGGLIAVAHQPRGPGATDESSAARGGETAERLARAGFDDVRVESLRLKPTVVCVLGVNRAGARRQDASSDVSPAFRTGPWGNDQLSG